jgi:hypothetical protein
MLKQTVSLMRVRTSSDLTAATCQTLRDPIHNSSFVETFMYTYIQTLLDKYVSEITPQSQYLFFDTTQHPANPNRFSDASNTFGPLPYNNLPSFLT